MASNKRNSVGGGGGVGGDGRHASDGKTTRVIVSNWYKQIICTSY